MQVGRNDSAGHYICDSTSRELQAEQKMVAPKEIFDKLTKRREREDCAARLVLSAVLKADKHAAALCVEGAESASFSDHNFGTWPDR